MSTSIPILVAGATVLSTAAMEGYLTARADVSNHRGELNEAEFAKF